MLIGCGWSISIGWLLQLSVELGNVVVFPMLQEDYAIGSCDYCLYVDLQGCGLMLYRLQDVVILHMRLGIGFQQDQFAT